MIPFEPTDHRANLPDWDSIEIPGMTETDAEQSRESRLDHHEEVNGQRPVLEQGWDVIENPESKLIAEEATMVREEVAELASPLQDLMTEGARQYRESFAATLPAFRELEYETRSLFRQMLDFLKQPVWIPGKGMKRKEYSRGTLFFLDIFRFGGTFAVIFIGLFLALNYQSFWQIAAAQVTPLIDPPSLDTKQDAGNAAVLQSVPLETDGLLAFLPDVGPPDNRLIIPKIGVNVPLVSPPTEALLRQNWDQVEKDIQSSLLNGAVLYPGTAKPGQTGNVFITSHSSNYPWVHSLYNTVGARFHDLQAGDDYWIYFNGDKHRYTVQSVKVVSPSDVSVLDQPADQRLGTLMTCDPVGTSLRRLIVVAQEVDPVSGVALKVGERSEPPAPRIGVQSLPM